MFLSSGKITVLGAGSWGTALAIHLASKGYNPILWTYRQNQLEEMKTGRMNVRYLSQAVIPENIYLSNDLEEAVRDAEIIVTAVPSHTLRKLFTNIKPYMDKSAILINGAKGIDENTLQRTSEIYKEIFNENRNFVVLSGPSHAEEVCEGMPTAVVVASKDKGSAVKAQNILMSSSFRVYTNSDVIGVELAGALKNIIALGTGIADGLSYGDNTKAALITRGLAEMVRLGTALGANPKTFSGLTGVGDLIVTCTSKHSRNLRAGIKIGQGKTVNQALKEIGMVVEGVRTTKAANKLSQITKVEMPITSEMYKVLFKEKAPKQGVIDLMARDKKDEMEEFVWDI
ncbi:MAG: NAD(P)H-dependent glycerol-3-phosphate dehydrogenase [Peptococcaceae bacterium]|nr:NAD(P)H-dependent glycerol-3-phosphate dehydrogenase [Peptococcaceae bacterium]